jgi:hypothetical protein
MESNVRTNPAWRAGGLDAETFLTALWNHCASFTISGGSVKGAIASLLGGWDFGLRYDHPMAASLVLIRRARDQSGSWEQNAAVWDVAPTGTSRRLGLGGALEKCKAALLAATEEVRQSRTQFIIVGESKRNRRVLVFRGRLADIFRTFLNQGRSVAYVCFNPARRIRWLCSAGCLRSCQRHSRYAPESYGGRGWPVKPETLRA